MKKILITLLLLNITLLLLAKGKHAAYTTDFVVVDSLEIRSDYDSALFSVQDEGQLPELFDRKYDLKEEVLRDSVEMEVNGFRIQLFKYDDLRIAKDREGECIQSFGEENVKLIFEEPFHKIRVGKFRLREEAQLFLESLQRMGYRNPIIVPDRVVVLVPNEKDK